ncbi:hypothetical protein Pcinc_005529 [Petrolisthes cinctipes]|uniref:Uncharacterized protein n=1 Tax=Petrolisthes cinctipes TaxID=88211 RepID=A0AAE1GES7_PETCI|nr:hypothetical protein Pcinc_005529 [Petrolisthes cinctipes]
MRIKAVSSTKIESERKYAQQCVALLLLHNNLKEKLVSFIRKEGEGVCLTPQRCLFDTTKVSVGHHKGVKQTPLKVFA